MRAQLARANGHAKLELLLSQPNPGALVRALPPEELLFAIHEIGLGDAAELVALASAEQFKAFIDFDCWRRDMPRPQQVLKWLSAARLGAGLNGLGRYRRKVTALDPELLVLVLQSTILVHDLGEGAAPDVAGASWPTPDGWCLVEFLGEGDEPDVVRRLLEDLYAEAPIATAQLLSNVRVETTGELAEVSYQWRTGRLRDLGVPSLEEAQRFFAPEKNAAPMATPSMALALQPDRDLLEAAAERIPVEALDEVEKKIAYAGNAVMVAELIDAADVAVAREALSEARATLSLGLWTLSGGDPARAAEILIEMPVQRIFQSGVAPGRALQRAADDISKMLAAPGSQRPILDAPLDTILSSLRRRRPRLGDLPIAHPKQVAQAQAALAEARSLARFADAMGLAPERIASFAAELERAPQSLALGGILLSMAAADARAPVALSREQAEAIVARTEAPLFRALDLAPDESSREAVARLLQQSWKRLRAEASRGPIDWAGTALLVVR